MESIKDLVNGIVEANKGIELEDNYLLDEFSKTLKYITARFIEAKIPSFDYTHEDTVDINGNSFEIYTYISWDLDKGAIDYSTSEDQEEIYVLGANKRVRRFCMIHIRSFLKEAMDIMYNTLTSVYSHNNEKIDIETISIEGK